MKRINNKGLGFARIIDRLFSSARVTPAELYRKQTDIQQVNPGLLRRGINRQWKRLHDPEFQTQEMINAIDRLVPIKK
jgi:hypothetical protein